MLPSGHASGASIDVDGYLWNEDAQLWTPVPTPLLATVAAEAGTAVSALAIVPGTCGVDEPGNSSFSSLLTSLGHFARRRPVQRVRGARRFWHVPYARRRSRRGCRWWTSGGKAKPRRWTSAC